MIPKIHDSYTEQKLKLVILIFLVLNIEVVIIIEV